MTAATKYQALTHLWTGETYIKEICSSFCRDKFLKEELISEIFLYLNELEENKLLNLFNTKQLRYFIVGMAKNQIRSKTSKFYRTYIRPDFSSDEFDVNKHETNKHDYAWTEKKEKIDIVEEAVDKLDFYRKELFRLYYMQNMSLMEISDWTASKNVNTRIPKTSIFNAIKSAKKDVFEYINNNYPDAYFDIKDSDLLKIKTKL
jgi:RNA polymerase sigma factor (sigma-70 family)